MLEFCMTLIGLVLSLIICMKFSGYDPETRLDNYDRSIFPEGTTRDWMGNVYNPDGSHNVWETMFPSNPAYWDWDD